MTLNYKKLGQFIELCNEKNSKSEIADSDLRGISNRKYFQKAKTNTIGVDLSKYRIVRKGQFAFNRATTRNGDRISIALQKEKDCIVSPSYRIFQSKDENVLDSEYLMMWFRRPEFDRYARFKSHGSAHEFFDFEEMCEVELPIPNITEQKKIVQQYKAVSNRIKLNKKINKKLEETAQTLYKHWFVDFEFPNHEGKPYFSSGGEMVYNEELDKEIPLGWEVGKLDKYVELSQGQVINAKTRYLVVDKGLPLLKITDLFNGTATMFIDAEKVSKKNIASKDDLIYTRTGQVGYIFRNKTGIVYNNCFKVIPIENLLNKEYIYWYLKEQKVKQLMIELASGSAQSDLTHKAFFSVSIIRPSERIQKEFEVVSLNLLNKIFLNDELNKNLTELQEVLLSKMSKVEETDYQI